MKHEFAIFTGGWILLMIVSSAFFYFSRNAGLKRRVFPLFLVGSMLLFLAFVLTRMPSAADAEFWVFAAAVMAIALFANLRSTRFCDSCGRTIRNAGIFRRISFCPRCGSRFPD